VPGCVVLVERLGSQLLAGRRPRDPVAVAERLLAIQGQDPRAVRLAVRARTNGVTAADIDRALSEDRSLVITWVNRGTLHLIRAEDYPLLQLLSAPPIVTANARRLHQEGVSPDAARRGVEVIVRSLADAGPLTRDQLRDRVAAAGVPTAGQALIHLLILASLRGQIVRGPMLGRHQAYALVRDWLPDLAPPPERDRALAELARRYLAGHQPADDRDLARWAGLPLRDARAGFDAIASQCRHRDDGLLELRRGSATPRPSRPRLPPPRLLGGWDPALLGWCSREPLLRAHAPAIVVGGLFRPFALVGGRAVATWKLTAGRVELAPLEPIDDADRRALEADGNAVRRFLGLS
jgi:hypothetical protein